MIPNKTTDTHNQKMPRLYLVAISGGLVLLILAAFEPLRHNEFINYDDPLYITENPHIREGFTKESVIWAFTAGYASNWHPLTWLSHMADIELFGLQPLGHHLHNLLLHTLSTVLLFWLLYRMTGSVWCSLFAAFTFGIHPLRIESVAWAAERKDVLSMLFCMLTLWAYLLYTQKRTLTRYMLVVLCYILGLMAKPILVTLPIILLLLDYWPLERIHGNLKASIIEKIPIFLLAIISCIITYAVQKSGGSVNQFSFYTRAANACVSYIAYLGKIFWPHNLAVLYPYPLSVYPFRLTAIVLSVSIAFSIFAICSRSKIPYLFTGWFWYMITLIPVIGIVKVGNQAMADRYTYLPSIGIGIILSWSAARLSVGLRLKKFITGSLFVLIIIVLMIGTRRQAAIWKDSITLFEHTLAVTENNAVIHNNIAWSFWKQGKEQQTIEHVKKALQINPAYADANIGMAFLLYNRKQYDKAMVYLNKVLESDPNHFQANLNMAVILIDLKSYDKALDYLKKSLAVNPDNADAWYNWGIILKAQNKTEEATEALYHAWKQNQKHYDAMCELGVLMFQKGLLDEAAFWFSKCISVNPKKAAAHFHLGTVLQKQDHFEEAILSYLHAMEIDPDNIDSGTNLALCQQKAGLISQAVVSYRKVLQLDPNSMPGLNNLTWILAASPDTGIRNPQEAIKLAERLESLVSPDNPDILDTLAAVYSANGQFEKAIATARKALDSANASGQSDLAGEISKRIELYQAGKFYFDPSLSNNIKPGRSSN